MKDSSSASLSLRDAGMASWGKAPAVSYLLSRVLAPIAITLAITAVGTGYYYHQVTGSAFRMTYRSTAIPTPSLHIFVEAATA